jgi:hypothetical protein
MKKYKTEAEASWNGRDHPKKRVNDHDERDGIGLQGSASLTKQV